MKSLFLNLCHIYLLMYCNNFTYMNTCKFREYFCFHICIHIQASENLNTHIQPNIQYILSFDCL